MKQLTRVFAVLYCQSSRILQMSSQISTDISYRTASLESAAAPNTRRPR
ncbi:hypothetical protein BH20ACI3_BH20ACI3_39830 [soil metagenome]